MLARTMIMFTTLTLLLMLIGFVVGYAFFGDPLTFTLLFLILAGVINLVSYEFSDRFVLWSTHAKIITESQSPMLFSIVRKVADEAHIPMPKVGIVESAQPNAFATGKGPSKAVVVATTSILKLLTPSELEAVIGHEISHVTHRDVLVSSIAATIAGAISYIGQMVIWSSFFGGFGNSRGRGNNDGSYFILAIVAAILVPIAAMLVQLGISRSRETSADEAGARLTQKPQELVNALRKISSTANAKQWNRANAPSPSTSSLWIVNPLRGASMAGLFSTHPPLQKRIKDLQRVGLELGVIVT
ncbi:MAG: M48 family metalloprotease [Nitrososphaerales archaeon]